MRLEPGQGIAVDIDETLAWTIGYWVEEMQRRFGNPEGLSVRAMVRIYRYTQNVPYWQTREAVEWMERQRNSNEVQLTLPLIRGSNTYLKKIAEVVPIAAYITTRPECVIGGTRQWLRKHGFPDAEIVCRPNRIRTEDGNRWKALALSERYPGIVGIIDDNPGMLDFLPETYKGYIFLYECQKIDSTLNAVPCKNWPAIYKEMKRVFPP
jgi:hypothetical protein